MQASTQTQPRKPMILPVKLHIFIFTHAHVCTYLYLHAYIFIFTYLYVIHVHIYKYKYFRREAGHVCRQAHRPNQHINPRKPAILPVKLSVCLCVHVCERQNVMRESGREFSWVYTKARVSSRSRLYLQLLVHMKKFMCTRSCKQRRLRDVSLFWVYMKRDFAYKIAHMHIYIYTCMYIFIFTYVHISMYI